MPVRFYGATSGYVELAAPAVAGSTSLELPTDSIKPGMVHLITQSINTSASGVTQFQGLFSAKYDAYRVLFSVRTKSGTTAYFYNFQLMSGSVVNNSSYNYTYRYLDSVPTSTFNYYGSTSAVIGGVSGYDESMYCADILYPYQARQTRFYGAGSRAGIQEMQGMWHGSTSSFDGMALSSLNPNGDTGTVYVYGYRI